MPIRKRVLERGRWRRRAGAIALAAVVGSTVYGDNRGLRAPDPAAELGGAVRRAASAWVDAAENIASIGILYGTVLSRMEPGVRRSILAAVEGIREVCTGTGSPKPGISRCATRRASPKKPARCARA